MYDAPPTPLGFSLPMYSYTDQATDELGASAKPTSMVLGLLSSTALPIAPL